VDGGAWINRGLETSESDGMRHRLAVATLGATGQIEIKS